MADIFNSRRGLVAVIPETEALPSQIRLEGFEPQAAIIESIHFHQASNQQFQTSLLDAVYIYVFGDQMGRLVMSGAAFIGRCSGGAPSGDRTGLVEVMEFYAQNRASQTAFPITATIGIDRISGFLTSLDLSPRDAENRINNFSFVINSLPRKQAG
jgi:hypothetical protein